MTRRRCPSGAKTSEWNDPWGVEGIPRLPGSYALLLRLEDARRIRVGKLGEFSFGSADYFYLGSARGPGGLQARLGRHLRGDGRRCWHVDDLRAASAVRGYAYTLGDTRLECAWSRALAALPGAIYAIAGFGASDCRTCPAHLVRLAGLAFEEALQALSGVCPGELVWNCIA